MRGIWIKLTALLSFLFIVLPGKALAAGGAGGDLVVVVADTRRFTGAMAFWTDMYNDSHLIFAIATIIIIPVVGVIMGLMADLVMSRIGIDLKHRDLAEH